MSFTENETFRRYNTGVVPQIVLGIYFFQYFPQQNGKHICTIIILFPFFASWTFKQPYPLETLVPIKCSHRFSF